MGFQAWLGKTVVDSNLLPAKITVHMVMALLIVALLVYLYAYTSPHEKEATTSPTLIKKPILLLSSLIMSFAIS